MTPQEWQKIVGWYKQNADPKSAAPIDDLVTRIRGKKLKGYDEGGNVQDAVKSNLSSLIDQARMDKEGRLPFQVDKAREAGDTRDFKQEDSGKSFPGPSNDDILDTLKIKAYADGTPEPIPESDANDSDDSTDIDVSDQQSDAFPSTSDNSSQDNQIMSSEPDTDSTASTLATFDRLLNGYKTDKNAYTNASQDIDIDNKLAEDLKKEDELKADHEDDSDEKDMVDGEDVPKKDSEIEASKKEPVEAPKPSPQEMNEGPKPSGVTASKQVDQRATFLDALKNAQSQQNTNETMANVLRGEQQILGAAGRRAPDYSTADALSKQASQPVTNLADQMKMGDLASKAQYNQQISDPNSPISKAYQQIAVKYGLDPKVVEGTNAEQLSKAIGPLISAGEKGRIAEILAGTKTGNKQEDFISKTREKFLNHDKTFQTLQEANDTLDKAIKEKNPINDVTAMYGFIHALNPKAIVRQSSTQMETQANGLLGNLELQLKGLTSKEGREKLTPQILQQMKNSITPILAQEQASRQALHDSYAQQAGHMGIDVSTRGNEMFPGYSGINSQSTQQSTMSLEDKKKRIAELEAKAKEQ